VYKVYVLNNSSRNERLDITSKFDFGHEHDVSVDRSDIGALCGWDDWRTEVRYVQGGQKYRVVFYNEDVVVPVYTDADLEKKKSSVLETFDAFPLSANASVLKDTEGLKATAVDVTKHVQKYAGPRRNWYRDRVSKRVETEHMFFGDDRRTVARWYPYLHMRTMKTLTSHPII
jgi:hypothetical protein